MKLKRLLMVGLAVAGAGYVTIAYAAGLYPDFPLVGGASYCAGSSSSATGSIIGLITGCPNTVPAGPSILTGNEQIAADTRLPSGANPQTVLVGMASLNALPVIVSAVNNNLLADSISAANVGGYILTNSATISQVNLTLPPSPIDGQQFALSSNRTITTLAMAAATGQSLANGSSPTVLTVSTTVPMGYRWLWNAATLSWYRLQ